MKIKNIHSLKIKYNVFTKLERNPFKSTSRKIYKQTHVKLFTQQFIQKKRFVNYFIYLQFYCKAPYFNFVIILGYIVSLQFCRRETYPIEQWLYSCIFFWNIPKHESQKIPKDTVHNKIKTEQCKLPPKPGYLRCSRE